ncbi:MAG: hypothetical protein HY291_17495 [Planctomycetes bacterium]|nr:hypothetical protein [Planctomycetota bacterium]
MSAMASLEQVPVLQTTGSIRRPSALSQSLRAIARDEAHGLRLAGRSAGLIVRPVRNAEEMDEVYRLTHDAYVGRGYNPPQPDGRLVHYPHLDAIPETTVLIAVENGRILGTNSITLDGPLGLSVDGDFKPECDAIRKERRPLATSWRIATREDLRSETRVVMGLIQETVRCGISAGVLTCMFTFNPRHERIYKKLLNLETVAQCAETKGLKNAPAILMRLDLENCPQRWLDTPELRARQWQILN